MPQNPKVNANKQISPNLTEEYFINFAFGRSLIDSKPSLAKVTYDPIKHVASATRCRIKNDHLICYGKTEWFTLNQS